MPEALLVLDQVVKRFGEHTAVAGVDLQFHRGEFLAIMGPSGCGKTTTLRMIAGLEQPSEGEIRLNGERINELKPWQRDTPLVWQNLALFPHLNVVKNIEFGLKMRNIRARERRERSMNWLERMGLADYAGRNIAQLSGGERQRLSIARELYWESELLILDEATSSVDSLLEKQIDEIISGQRGTKTIVVIAHRLATVRNADIIYVFDGGRIVESGTFDDLVNTGGLFARMAKLQSF